MKNSAPPDINRRELLSQTQSALDTLALAARERVTTLLLAGREVQWSPSALASKRTMHMHGIVW